MLLVDYHETLKQVCPGRTLNQLQTKAKNEREYKAPEVIIVHTRISVMCITHLYVPYVLHILAECEVCQGVAIDCIGWCDFVLFTFLEHRLQIIRIYTEIQLVTSRSHVLEESAHNFMRRSAAT